jgi:hypothetical protein
MNLQDLKNQFDQALAKMSDQDIVSAFAEMGCAVEIEAQVSDWTCFEEIHCELSTRPLREPFLSCALVSAANSNELALAA